MKTALVLTLATLNFLIFSQASAKTSVCQEAPAFVETENEATFDAAGLPERVMVARSVEVWMTNKEHGMRLLGRHDFKSMKSEVLCSKAPAEGAINLTTWVPALLDLSREKSWGHSVWQLHILTEPKRAGIWSQKSRLAPADEARRLMQKGNWRFLGSNVYELVWDQEEKGTHQYFRVVFDVLNP